MKSLHCAVLAMSIAVVTCVPAAEMTQAEAERFSKQLTFDSVKSFNDARDRLKARADAAQYVLGYLQEKALQSQVSREMEKVLPEVQKALATTPKQCALVSVNVDSASNGTSTQYSLRNVQFEGVGDAAVQVLAPKVFSNSKTGSFDKAPVEGFSHDDGMSHLLCFGMVDGQSKATEVFMPTLRAGLTAAVQELEKADDARKAEEERKAQQARKDEEARQKKQPEHHESTAERPDSHDVNAERIHERAERDRADREKADHDRAGHERADHERADREKADHERADRDKASREKADWEKTNHEKKDHEPKPVEMPPRT